MPSPVGGALIGGTAPVGFVSAAPTTQVDSDLVVEWDFDNDGDFDGPDEDITARVMAAETLTGRDWPSQLYGKAGPGQLKLTLDNTDDAFSYFNADSPFNQAGNSLRTGRKIRVRTAESVPVDPLLLARDRFNHPAGPIDGRPDDQGGTWDTAGSDAIVVTGSQTLAVGGAFDVDHFAWLDVNTPDGYAQATLPKRPPPGSAIGVIARLTPFTDFVAAFAFNGLMWLFEKVGGVNSIIDTLSIDWWPGATFGLGIDGGDVATAYVNGVAVMSATTAVTTGDNWGVLLNWSSTQPFNGPEVDDFAAWTDVQRSVDGVLWTGDVTEVTTTAEPGGLKVASVTAEGVLARASGADVTSPQAAAGAPTGLLVGDAFARAGLLDPPGDAIDLGSITTGPVGIDDGKALDLARLFEETEDGFIFEQPEGPPGFQDRAARDLAASTGWWSDTPGVGQYPYAGIAPYDHKREVVNQVTAGIAPDRPGEVIVTTRTANTAFGVQNHVDVLMPTVSQDDLLLVFIASTVTNASVGWITPYWWIAHRDVGSSTLFKLYSHLCSGEESGTTVRFYGDSTSSGGAWIAKIVQVRGWFANYEGLSVEPARPGLRPPSLDPPWEREATLYVVAAAGLTSVAGGTLASPTAPQGYEGGLSATSLNGSVNGFDVALLLASKVDTSGREEPTAFTGPSGYVINESWIVGLRGFNGPFTRPRDFVTKPVGGAGRFTTLDDFDSQVDHNAVITYKTASTLFADLADADDYCARIIERHGDDRPIFELRFWATSSEQLREQAFTRRVGDLVTLTSTGDSGQGIEGDFFVESIGHAVTNGGKVWQVTWQLSPA